MRLLCIVLFFVTYLAGYRSLASKDLFPPKPHNSGYIIDFADVVKDKAKLEKELSAYKDTSGNTIYFVTVEKINKYTIHEYADLLAEKWETSGKIGPHTVLMVWEERKHRFGVGAGSALIDNLPISLSERIEDDFFTGNTKNTSDINGVYKAKNTIALVLSSPPGTFDFSNISFWSFLIIAFLIAFFLFGYPYIMFRQMKSLNLRSKPSKFWSPLYLRNSFGGVNYRDFNHSLGSFKVEKTVKKNEGGGGATGNW